MPTGSTPPCLKKFLSSAASTAFCISGETSDSGTTTRFTSPCNEARALDSLQFFFTFAAQMNDVWSTTGLVVGICTCDATHMTPIADASTMTPMKNSGRRQRHNRDRRAAPGVDGSTRSARRLDADLLAMAKDRPNGRPQMLPAQLRTPPAAAPTSTSAPAPGVQR